MCDSQQKNEKVIIAGYQSAINLMHYEGSLAWKMIGVYLPFSTVLIAGAFFPSYIQTEDKFIVYLVALILSILGFLSSVYWTCMILRSIKYYIYWIHKAREYEKLLPVVDTLTIGQQFSEGKKVKVDGVEIECNSFEKIKAKQIIEIVFFIFASVFLILMIYNLYRFLNFQYL